MKPAGVALAKGWLNRALAFRPHVRAGTVCLGIGLGVLLIGSSASAQATHHQTHRGSAYDGLVFRVIAPTHAGLGGTLTGCSSALQSAYTWSGSSEDVPATTLRRGTNGLAVQSARLGLYLLNGQIVFVNGGGPTSQEGVGIAFGSAEGSCSLPIQNQSAAGAAYAISWNDTICDNPPSCTAGHQSVTGTGCVAIARTADSLAATVQLGTCDPSGFPPLPTGWSSATTSAASKATRPRRMVYSAVCRDGTTSRARAKASVCHGHGGIKRWLKK